MKVLYYSTAYHAHHGGRNHSRQFVDKARASKLASHVEVFPDFPSDQHALFRRDSKIRSLLKNNAVTQVFSFVRRSRLYQQALLDKVEAYKPDAVLIRLDSNFRQVRVLRKRYPQLVIATEVNASTFDEGFRNIASRRYFQKLEREHLELADCNFFVSEVLRANVMGERVDASRDFIVHNGVDESLFKPMGDRAELRKKFSLSPDDFIIGYLGTLDVHKRIGDLINAFGKVVKLFPACRLVIAGRGPADDDIRRRVAESGFAGSVALPGWVAHSEIPQLINCFDIAVHHRANEYMSPLKLFEYLACGVASIAPDTPAIREIFTPGLHLVLTSGQPDALANDIVGLIKDEACRQRLSTAGRNHVVDNYTWKRNADFILSNISLKFRRRASA